MTESETLAVNGDEPGVRNGLVLAISTSPPVIGCGKVHVNVFVVALLEQPVEAWTKVMDDGTPDVPVSEKLAVPLTPVAVAVTVRAPVLVGCAVTCA